MRIPTPAVPATIEVTSPAFRDGGTLPRRHTCEGAGLSPELSWRNVPPGAASIAVVVSDPDAPRGAFLHWLVYEIAPDTTGLASGAVPPGSRESENSARRPGWFPPCPPSGTHRYVFTVHALDARARGRDSQHLLDHLAGHTIAWGSLTGLASAG